MEKEITHYELGIDMGDEGTETIATGTDLNELIATAEKVKQEYDSPMFIDAWQGDEIIESFKPIRIK